MRPRLSNPVDRVAGILHQRLILFQQSVISQELQEEPFPVGFDILFRFLLLIFYIPEPR
mgnify:CR=1 FL=1